MLMVKRERKGEEWYTLGYLGLKVAKRILAGPQRLHRANQCARAGRMGTENT